jgi:deoxyribose-phosphate aldolase
MIAEVRAALPDDATLKVVFDPALFSAEQLAAASRLAIEEGAQFIKAGTGRSSMATRLQLMAMLEAIRDGGKSCGLVVSGPFGDFAAMKSAFDLAAETIGEPWANAERFRLSSIDALAIALKAIEGSGS